MGNHQHGTHQAGQPATAARCDDGIAAIAADLLAWSDALDLARAAGLAQGRAEAAAARVIADMQIERARAEGYAAAVAEVKAVQRGIVHTLAEAAGVERARWHLCCPPCRRTGHKPGCARCEDRTRETFGRPMEGDYRGGPVPVPTDAELAGMLAELVERHAAEDAARRRAVLGVAA